MTMVQTAINKTKFNWSLTINDYDLKYNKYD